MNELHLAIHGTTVLAGAVVFLMGVNGLADIRDKQLRDLAFDIISLIMGGAVIAMGFDLI